jgi:SAM-dependent methyltransferase
MAFRDHFSRQAGPYAAGRPTYPDELIDWLAAQCARRELAWDAGCGSGLAALALASRFTRVEASDPSDRQLAAAAPDPRVRYHLAAERLPALRDGSVDLVTVAQAWHWLDHAAFGAEVARVAAPGAVLAAWTYDLPRVTPAVDAVVDALYAGLGPWWPPERRHVENRYAGIPLPGRPLEAPAFAMRATWDLARLRLYLASWSAVAACLAATGADPVAAREADLGRAWGAAGAHRTITWPLTVLAARA